MFGISKISVSEEEMLARVKRFVRMTLSSLASEDQINRDRALLRRIQQKEPHLEVLVRKGLLCSIT